MDIAELLKRHYEKIILSVILALLAVIFAFLPKRIDNIRQQLQENRDSLVKTAKNYQPINIAGFEAMLNQMTNLPVVKLSGGHNLFSPVLWLYDAQGQLVKVVSEKQVGPEALKVTQIKPLNYIISLERVSGSSYTMAIVDESAVRPVDRKPKTRYVSQTSPKCEFFRLAEVKGDPTNPDALVLELTGEDKKNVEVSKDKPYKEVRAYVADMKYEMEGLSFDNKRVNEIISFAGDEYKIEDIRPTEVVLVSQTSTRRFIIKYTQN